jgi:hypothetical protein
MILSVILSIFVSLLIIILGHKIWNYLEESYSVKKTDNIVHSQIEKYKNIIEELHNNSFKCIEPDLKNDLEIFLNEIH